MAKSVQKWLPIGLVLVGFFMVFKDRIFGAIATVVEHGLALSFERLRFSFGNTITIPVVNIKIPTTATAHADMRITNTNLLGGRVNSIQGFLRYGPDGPQLMPLSNFGFNLGAGETVNFTVDGNINVLMLTTGLKDVFSKLVNREITSLWVDVNVSTSYGSFQVLREMPVTI